MKMADAFSTGHFAFNIATHFTDIYNRLSLN